MNTHGTVQPRYRSNSVYLTRIMRSLSRGYETMAIGAFQRASGGDTSHYNLPAVLDPSKSQPGYESDFWFNKITEGIGFLDDSYEIQWPGMLELPGRGPYHYMRSQWGGIAQASWFMLNIDKYLSGVNLIGWDFEGYGNTFTTGFMVETYIGMNYVSARTDAKLLLYTNRSLREWLYDESLRYYGEDVFAKFGFWYAVPNKNADDNPIMPKGVDHWDILQEWWDYPGYLTGIDDPTIDYNVYNGTRAEMLAWLGIEEVPPEEDVITQEELDQIEANLKTIRNKANASLKIIQGPDEPAPTETYICKADSLYIRETPGGAATGAYLYYNNECQVDDSTLYNGTTWYHHDGGPSQVPGWSSGEWLQKKVAAA